MHIIVIPDLHHRTHIADQIITHEAKNGPLRIIFLGDYFDDWDDGPALAARTASWLEAQLEATDEHQRDFILGNHDLPYLFPGALHLFDRAGDTVDKRLVVGSILGTKYQSRFVLSTKVPDRRHGGWLLSHAGVTNPLWTLYGHKIHEIEDALCLDNTVYPLLLAGQDRGGLQRHGGIVWCDWRSFVPVQGVNQLVGHTPGADIRKTTIVKLTHPELGDSTNYCIDTDSQHYAVYDPETNDWDFVAVTDIS